jgi:hypothetical protein
MEAAIIECKQAIKDIKGFMNPESEVLQAVIKELEDESAYWAALLVAPSVNSIHAIGYKRPRLLVNLPISVLESGLALAQFNAMLESIQA